MIRVSESEQNRNRARREGAGEGAGPEKDPVLHLMMETGNCVARLNEFSQKRRAKLHYDDLGFVGPDHDRV